MKKRIHALILALLVLIALAASGAFLAYEAGHDCGRTDCPICTAVLQCGHIARLLSCAGCLAGVVMVLQTAAALRIAYILHLTRFHSTPVSLKVLLLD